MSASLDFPDHFLISSSTTNSKIKHFCTFGLYQRYFDHHHGRPELERRQGARAPSATNRLRKQWTHSCGLDPNGEGHGSCSDWDDATVSHSSVVACVQPPLSLAQDPPFCKYVVLNTFHLGFALFSPLDRTLLVPPFHTFYSYAHHDLSTDQLNVHALHRDAFDLVCRRGASDATLRDRHHWL